MAPIAPSPMKHRRGTAGNDCAEAAGPFSLRKTDRWIDAESMRMR
jgi:hypothetical protein